MPISGYSAPMTNSRTGEEYERGGLRFGSSAEEISGFLARTAGKALLISDGTALSALAAASAAPRTCSVVLEEDALPLFAISDGVGGVVASGNACTLRAARCFAEIHGIPCLLLPVCGALDGVFERTGSIAIDGARAELPLAQGEVVCDLPRMRKSLPLSYARLLLSRLAIFEAKALARFRMGEYPSLCERALSQIEFSEDPAKIVLSNAAIRKAEAEGLPSGEGAALSRAIPAETAYRALCALYGAFFRSGKPRRYFTPDYRARAAEAQCEFSACVLPTREEYAARALALERMRGACGAELSSIVRENPAHLRRIRALGGEIAGSRGIPPQLKTLPEKNPGGLSSVIRDFGLMEWETAACVRGE